MTTGEIVKLLDELDRCKAQASSYYQRMVQDPKDTDARASLGDAEAALRECQRICALLDVCY